jgi:hypothetical protein
VPGTITFDGLQISGTFEAGISIRSVASLALKVQVLNTVLQAVALRSSPLNASVLRVTCMYVHSCTHVSSPLRTIDTIPSTVDPRLISFAWTRLRRGASVSTHCTTVLSRF